jgi:predicted branched-subunit amino acid permease
VPLTFIAMVVPLLSDRAMLIAALTGGLASVLLILPLKLNLIAAALIGIAAGLATERWRGKR